METIETIARWHRETFPDTSLLKQLEKFQEEKKEWQKSQRITNEGLIVGDIMELADMQIVACGLARFDSVEAIFAFRRVAEELEHTACATIDLQRAVEAKMKVNRNRQWCNNNGLYRHKED